MSSMTDLDERDPEGPDWVGGLTSGIVSQNRDPDGLGRVKIKLPWREDDFETGWVRVASPMAGPRRGAWFLPEVGDEVLVGFDRGDIRFPYVLGGLWSSANPPPATNENGANDIRLIRSRSGHVLLFDDSGDGRIVIELAEGGSITLDGSGIVIDDGANRVSLDAAAGALTIESKQTLTLRAPRIAIEASASVAVNGEPLAR